MSGKNQKNPAQKNQKKPAVKSSKTGAAKSVNSTDSSPQGTPVTSDLTFDFGLVLEKLNESIAAKEKGEPALESMNSSISLILTTLQEVTKALENQAQSYDNLLKENQSQTKTIEKLVNEVNECKKVNKAVTEENENLNRKINDLEQYSRNFNLEIQGVPVTDSENTYTIVADIANYLGEDITTDDIEFCHRLRKSDRNPSKPPAIVAKFYSRQIKEGILIAKRKSETLMTGALGFGNVTNNKIFINEHLTSMNKNLFWLARNTKQLGYKYAWTKAGKVFLRKNEDSPVIRVQKQSDIPAEGS
jgi:Baculovirus FP protein